MLARLLSLSSFVGLGGDVRPVRWVLRAGGGMTLHFSVDRLGLNDKGLVAGRRPRTARALIGAAAAVLLMLIAASEHGLKLISIRHALEVLVIVFVLHGTAIRFWNYSLCTAAIAAGVLLAIDLPTPPTTALRENGCAGRWSAWRSPCS